MRGGAFAISILLGGCGPLVAFGTDSDGDSEGDTDAGSSDGGEASFGSSSEGGTIPPGTVGDAVTGEPPDPSIGDDFPSSELCWQTMWLFDAPDSVGVIPADQNSDEREEVWLFWDSDGGQGPGETTVYGIDDSATILTDFVIDGFGIGFGDVGGDGLLDLVTVTFGGGGPPYFGFAQATGFANFMLPPGMFDLEISQRTSGFFDVTGDTLLDAFHLRDDGALELLVGDGFGSFSLSSEIPIGMIEFASAEPVANSSTSAVVYSVPDFGNQEDCFPTQYKLVDGSGGALQDLANTDASDLGSLRGAEVDLAGNTVLYVDSCAPDDVGDRYDLRQLVAGAGTFAEYPAAIDKVWVTVGDFDGDGYPDLVFADPDAETMSFARGTGPQTFARPEATDVLLTDTRDNNVRALDMDGDGRDELVRGTVISEGTNVQLTYERIFLAPC